jgi:hypothetical protein
MTGNPREDLELRLKKNRGHRLVAEWSGSLSGACGIEISASSFLPIERTMELKRAFFTKVKARSEESSRCWDKQERDTVVSHLLNACVEVRSISVVLFSSVDQFVGAVRVPADSVLRNAMSVWEVVKEDLSLTTEDLQHGLCLEENFYTTSGDYVRGGLYELTAWGVFEAAL